MIRIVATHYASYNENFNCSSCVIKHSEDRRNRLKGCSEIIKNPVAKYKDRVIFYKCPSNFYSAYIAGLMGHARHIESGLLPYSGGLLDQPAKLVDIYNQINALRVEDEVTRAKAEADKARKAARKGKGYGI